MRASVFISLVSAFWAATTIAHPLAASSGTDAVSERDSELEPQAFMSDA